MSEWFKVIFFVLLRYIFLGDIAAAFENMELAGH